MKARLTELLARALRVAARLLPAPRREWAEAVQAEASLLPAGWPRLDWLAGGLWMVLKEANVVRKVIYWLGIGAVAATAAWAMWLSWRAAQVADAEAVTDRVRILVVATAMLGLPWVARRHGWFGPVASTVPARLTRVWGCAAICGIGIALLRADSHAGGNAIGLKGGFSALHEVAGLVLVAALVAVPLIVRARRPSVDPSTLWSITGVAGVSAWMLLPLQLLAVGYVVAVLFATSRRAPLASTQLVVGMIAGVVMGLIAYGLAGLADQLLPVYLGLLAIITLAVAGTAGALAAWLLPDTAECGELREACIRQGLLAGAVAGAAGALLLTNLSLFLFFTMIIGPPAGLVGGALGGAFAAMHPLKRGPDGARAWGLFVSGS